MPEISTKASAESEKPKFLWREMLVDRAGHVVDEDRQQRQRAENVDAGVPHGCRWGSHGYRVPFLRADVP